MQHSTLPPKRAREHIASLHLHPRLESLVCDHLVRPKIWGEYPEVRSLLEGIDSFVRSLDDGASLRTPKTMEDSPSDSAGDAIEARIESAIAKDDLASKQRQLEATRFEVKKATAEHEALQQRLKDLHSLSAATVNEMSQLSHVMSNLEQVLPLPPPTPVASSSALLLRRRQSGKRPAQPGLSPFTPRSFVSSASSVASGLLTSRSSVTTPDNSPLPSDVDTDTELTEPDEAEEEAATEVVARDVDSSAGDAPASVEDDKTEDEPSPPEITAVPSIDLSSVALGVSGSITSGAEELLDADAAEEEEEAEGLLLDRMFIVIPDTASPRSSLASPNSLWSPFSSSHSVRKHSFRNYPASPLSAPPLPRTSPALRRASSATPRPRSGRSHRRSPRMSIFDVFKSPDRSSHAHLRIPLHSQAIPLAASRSAEERHSRRLFELETLSGQPLPTQKEQQEEQQEHKQPHAQHHSSSQSIFGASWARAKRRHSVTEIPGRPRPLHTMVRRRSARAWDEVQNQLRVHAKPEHHDPIITVGPSPRTPPVHNGDTKASRSAAMDRAAERRSRRRAQRRKADRFQNLTVQVPQASDIIQTAGGTEAVTPGSGSVGDDSPRKGNGSYVSDVSSLAVSSPNSRDRNSSDTLSLSRSEASNSGQGTSTHSSHHHRRSVSSGSALVSPRHHHRRRSGDHSRRHHHRTHSTSSVSPRRSPLHVTLQPSASVVALAQRNQGSGDTSPRKGPTNAIGAVALSPRAHIRQRGHLSAPRHRVSQEEEKAESNNTGGKQTDSGSPSHRALSFPRRASARSHSSTSPVNTGSESLQVVVSPRSDFFQGLRRSSVGILGRMRQGLRRSTSSAGPSPRRRSHGSRSKGRHSRHHSSGATVFFSQHVKDEEDELQGPVLFAGIDDVSTAVKSEVADKQKKKAKRSTTSPPPKSKRKSARLTDPHGLRFEEVSALLSNQRLFTSSPEHTPAVSPNRPASSSSTLNTPHVRPEDMPRTALGKAAYTLLSASSSPINGAASTIAQPGPARSSPTTKRRSGAAPLQVFSPDVSEDERDPQQHPLLSGDSVPASETAPAVRQRSAPLAPGAVDDTNPPERPPLLRPTSDPMGAGSLRLQLPQADYPRVVVSPSNTSGPVSPRSSASSPSYRLAAHLSSSGVAIDPSDADDSQSDARVRQGNSPFVTPLHSPHGVSAVKSKSPVSRHTTPERQHSGQDLSSAVEDSDAELKSSPMELQVRIVDVSGDSSPVAHPRSKRLKAHSSDTASAKTLPLTPSTRKRRDKMITKLKFLRKKKGKEHRHRSGTSDKQFDKLFLSKHRVGRSKHLPRSRSRIMHRRPPSLVAASSQPTSLKPSPHSPESDGRPRRLPIRHHSTDMPYRHPLGSGRMLIGRVASTGSALPRSRSARVVSQVPVTERAASSSSSTSAPPIRHASSSRTLGVQARQLTGSRSAQSLVLGQPRRRQRIRFSPSRDSFDSGTSEERGVVLAAGAAGATHRNQDSVESFSSFLSDASSRTRQSGANSASIAWRLGRRGSGVSVQSGHSARSHKTRTLQVPHPRALRSPVGPQSLYSLPSSSGGATSHSSAPSDVSSWQDRRSSLGAVSTGSERTGVSGTTSGARPPLSSSDSRRTMVSSVGISASRAEALESRRSADATDESGRSEDDRTSNISRTPPITGMKHADSQSSLPSSSGMVSHSSSEDLPNLSDNPSPPKSTRAIADPSALHTGQPRPERPVDDTAKDVRSLSSGSLANGVSGSGNSVAVVEPSVVAVQPSSIIPLHNEHKQVMDNELVYDVPYQFPYGTTSPEAQLIVERVGALNVLRKPLHARTDEDVTVLLRFFSRIGLFCNISSEQRQELCRFIELVSLPGDAVVFEQGDEGDSYYVVLVGSVSVIVRDKFNNEGIVAVLGEDDDFGELALLHRQRRTATIKTREPTQLLRVNKETFLGVIHPEDNWESEAVKASGTASTGMTLHSKHNGCAFWDDPDCPLTREQRIAKAVEFIEDAAAEREIKTHRLGEWPTKVYTWLKHKQFQRFITAAILLHMSLIILEPPSHRDADDAPYKDRMPYLLAVEWCCWLTHATAAGMRAYAFGARWFGGSLINHTHVALILFIFCDLLAASVTSGNVLRFSRLCRPMLLLVQNQQLRKMYKIAVMVVPHLTELAVLVGGLLVFYMTFGYHLFHVSGDLYQEANFMNGTGPYRCDGAPCGHIEPYQFQSFSTLGRSALTLFVLLTSENYPNVMYPPYLANNAYIAFFVSFLAVGLFFMMNLAVVVIYDAYREASKEITMKERIREREALHAAFQCLDFYDTQKITLPVFTDLMRLLRPEYEQFMIDATFSLMDADKNNLLEEMEFFEICDMLFLTISIKKSADAPDAGSSYCDWVRQLGFREALRNLLDRETVKRFVLAVVAVDLLALFAMTTAESVFSAIDTGCVVVFVLESASTILVLRSYTDLTLLHCAHALTAGLCTTGVAAHYSGEKRLATLRFTGVIRLFRLLDRAEQYLRRRSAQATAKEQAAKQDDDISSRDDMTKPGSVADESASQVDNDLVSGLTIDSVRTAPSKSGQAASLPGAQQPADADSQAEKAAEPEQEEAESEDDQAHHSFTAAFLRMVPVFLAMVFALVSVVLYSYAVLGMEVLGVGASGCSLAGQVDNDPRARFCDFPTAMLTLFQILTTSNWHDVMFNAMASTSDYVAWYFITFFLVAVLLLLNLVTAVILDTFLLEANLKRKEGGVQLHQLLQIDQEADDGDSAMDEDEYSDDESNGMSAPYTLGTRVGSTSSFGTVGTMLEQGRLSEFDPHPRTDLQMVLHPPDVAIARGLDALTPITEMEEEMSQYSRQSLNSRSMLSMVAEDESLERGSTVSFGTHSTRSVMDLPQVDENHLQPLAGSGSIELMAQPQHKRALSHPIRQQWQAVPHTEQAKPADQAELARSSNTDGPSTNGTATASALRNSAPSKTPTAVHGHTPAYGLVRGQPATSSGQASPVLSRSWPEHLARAQEVHSNATESARLQQENTMSSDPKAAAEERKDGASQPKSVDSLVSAPSGRSGSPGMAQDATSLAGSKDKPGSSTDSTHPTSVYGTSVARSRTLSSARESISSHRTASSPPSFARSATVSSAASLGGTSGHNSILGQFPHQTSVDSDMSHSGPMSAHTRSTTNTTMTSGVGSAPVSSTSATPPRPRSLSLSSPTANGAAAWNMRPLSAHPHRAGLPEHGSVGDASAARLGRRWMMNAKRLASIRQTAGSGVQSGARSGPASPAHNHHSPPSARSYDTENNPNFAPVKRAHTISGATCIGTSPGGQRSSEPQFVEASQILVGVVNSLQRWKRHLTRAYQHADNDTHKKTKSSKSKDRRGRRASRTARDFQLKKLSHSLSRHFGNPPPHRRRSTMRNLHSHRDVLAVNAGIGPSSGTGASLPHSTSLPQTNLHSTSLPPLSSEPALGSATASPNTPGSATVNSANATPRRRQRRQSRSSAAAALIEPSVPASFRRMAPQGPLGGFGRRH